MAHVESNAGAPRAADEFTITRLFDAPLDLLFEVWTDCAHLRHWWGPKGVTVFACRMDLRAGGTFHYGLRGPEYGEIWGKWVFREVVAPERLVFISSFSDEAGNLTRHPMAPNWPLQTLSAIEFVAQGGRTAVTVRWSPYEATALERQTFEDGRPSMQQGWGGTFEQLAAYLQQAGRAQP